MFVCDQGEVVAGDHARAKRQERGWAAGRGLESEAAALRARAQASVVDDVASYFSAAIT